MLTFVSYQLLTTLKEIATDFAGTGLASDSLTKTAQAVGNSDLSEARVATATIKVTGSDAGSAVTTINVAVVPAIGVNNPLTEAELAAFDTFLTDVQTAVADVEGSIVWS